MIATDLLYRKFRSADFVPFDEESKIMPVRIKNEYVKQDQFFDFEKNAWLPLLDCKKNLGYSEEFVEFPYKSENCLCKDFEEEDFCAEEMARFLKFRSYKRRMEFNRKNFYDSNNIEKDFLKAKITADTEKLLLRIDFTKFARNENAEPEYEKEIPRFEETFLVFDMKNACADFSCFEDFYSSDKEHLCSRLDLILPYEVVEKAFERLVEIAEAFAGVSFDALRQEIKTKRVKLYDFYTLTMLPFCPKLYDIINNKEIKKRKVYFKPKRNDSKVFNRFCRRHKIQNTKTLRKIFQERPGVLITFLRLKDAGFRDINLYNRVLESLENSRVIDGVEPKSLAFFCRCSIKKRGQKAAMNSIFRSVENYRDDINNLYDGLKMFEKYFKRIPATLKNEIMADGFTDFNHNALATLAYQYENKNVVFSYSGEQKALEDELGGYSFRLPDNSYQLCQIGNALHNCVASYSDSVKNKECTIVYATKDGECKICIEVRGNKVFQERVDRNKAPDREQRVLLAKWRGRHRLQLR